MMRTNEMFLKIVWCDMNKNAKKKKKKKACILAPSRALDPLPCMQIIHILDPRGWKRSLTDAGGTWYEPNPLAIAQHNHNIKYATNQWAGYLCLNVLCSGVGLDAGFADPMADNAGYLVWKQRCGNDVGEGQTCCIGR